MLHKKLLAVSLLATIVYQQPHFRANIIDPTTVFDTKTDEPIADLIYASELIEEHPNLIYKGKGRITDEYFSDIYRLADWSDVRIPRLDEALKGALKHHKKLLEKKDYKETQYIDNMEVSMDDLSQVIDILSQENPVIPITEQLEAWQIQGKDRKGNVKFTGYYSPLIQVDSEPSAEYNYPVYSRPRNWSGKLPTREEIDFGLLSDRGLEIGYAKHPFDVYLMQIQGSGYVQYPDGRKELWSYDGTNRHSYRSIGQMMVRNDRYRVTSISADGIRSYLDRHPEYMNEILHYNRSYTFFNRRKKRIKGAGHVPLTTQISAAIDPRFIPMGACVLAAVPVRNQETRRIDRHEYRILLAQDIGGAIKGSGRVDIFTGIGEEARRIADDLHHYGRLWLLMPKDGEIEEIAVM